MKLILLISLLAPVASVWAAPRTFIDYFEPTPIVSSLVTNVWGAPTVGARDPKNGLEDESMKQ